MSLPDLDDGGPGTARGRDLPGHAPGLPSEAGEVLQGLRPQGQGDVREPSRAPSRQLPLESHRVPPFAGPASGYTVRSGSPASPWFGRVRRRW